MRNCVHWIIPAYSCWNLWVETGWGSDSELRKDDDQVQNFEGIVGGKLKYQAKYDIEGNKPTTVDALEQTKRAHVVLSFESIKKVKRKEFQMNVCNSEQS